MGKIGFLHTSPVHIPTFDSLILGRVDQIELEHKVDEELLAYAMANGPDQHVEAKVNAYLHGLAQTESTEIVCTCSTLGGIAEKVLIEGVNVTRLDRPMAAKAVQTGHIILMAAAIRSTLSPTRELLLDESRRQNRPIQVIDCVVESAWDYFLAGDLHGYAAEIASGVRQALAGDGLCAPKLVPEVVILAQASMAPAAEFLADLRQPVLSSPQLCADYLVTRFENHR